MCGGSLLLKIFSKGTALPAYKKDSFFLGSWVQTDTNVINTNLQQLPLFKKNKIKIKIK